MEAPSLVDQAHEAMLEAWRLATGGPPPPGLTAFDAACWRLAAWVNDEFEGPHDVDEVVAVVCRARSWLTRRKDWDRPPQMLCDYAQGAVRRRFWLVDREEALKHGESYS